MSMTLALLLAAAAFHVAVALAAFDYQPPYRRKTHPKGQS